MSSRKSRQRGLRVGVDMVSAGSGFRPGAGGMISYYDGLLRAMVAMDDVEAITVFVDPENGRLAVPDDPKVTVVTCRRLRERRPLRILYEQTALAWLARRADIDVLLCTSNIMPLVRRAPTAVVLQSIQYFIWPEEIGPARRLYMHQVIPRSVRKADVVIAVSEAERRDALELFGSEPGRMVSIHHGPSNWVAEAATQAATTEPYEIPTGRRYVLAISRLYRFKNHRRLIEAYAAAVERANVEQDLVIVGGDADVTAADLREVADATGVGERIHVLGQLPQADVPALFAGADAVAYVSLYETFGHPVLEAFGMGVALITASVSGSAEVAGADACLVDPEDADAIADALVSVLTDGATRERLREAGRRRLADFSWERCAEETVAALKVAARDG